MVSSNVSPRLLHTQATSLTLLPFVPAGLPADAGHAADGGRQPAGRPAGRGQAGAPALGTGVRCLCCGPCCGSRVAQRAGKANLPWCSPCPPCFRSGCQVAADVAQALDHLHRQLGIMHGDLSSGWEQLLSMLLGVAPVHFICPPFSPSSPDHAPVAPCLPPSNVLLDGGLRGHLGDLGLAFSVASAAPGGGARGFCLTHAGAGQASGWQPACCGVYLPCLLLSSQHPSKWPALHATPVCRGAILQLQSRCWASRAPLPPTCTAMECCWLS